MPRRQLKPGDRLTTPGLHGVITREIVDVRETGYGWRYPGPEYAHLSTEKNYFWSENSMDPFFEGSWWTLEETMTVNPTTVNLSQIENVKFLVDGLVSVQKDLLRISEFLNPATSWDVSSYRTEATRILGIPANGLQIAELKALIPLRKKHLEDHSRGIIEILNKFGMHIIEDRLLNTAYSDAAQMERAERLAEEAALKDTAL